MRGKEATLQGNFLPSQQPLRFRNSHSAANSRAISPNSAAWFHSGIGGQGWFSGTRAASGRSSQTRPASASV